MNSVFSPSGRHDRICRFELMPTQFSDVLNVRNVLNVRSGARGVTLQASLRGRRKRAWIWLAASPERTLRTCRTLRTWHSEGTLHQIGLAAIRTMIEKMRLD